MRKGTPPAVLRGTADRPLKSSKARRSSRPLANRCRGAPGLLGLLQKGIAVLIVFDPAHHECSLACVFDRRTDMDTGLAVQHDEAVMKILRASHVERDARMLR